MKAGGGHMMKFLRRSSGLVLLALLVSGQPASAQVQTSAIPRWARVSLFAQAGNTTSHDGGGSSSFTEIVTSVSAASAIAGKEPFDYGLNLRYAGYPSQEGHASRSSIYEAWAGKRLLDGRLFVRVGQMWLNDLGSLGSFGGGVVEYIHAGTSKTTGWRAGGFFGVEPKVMELGFVPSVSKFGVYVAIEAPDMRRHVVGYVNIHNHSLTERSVLTFTNYVPWRKRLFVYQMAEIDLTSPSAPGFGGLTYFFLNARYMATSRIEVQGLFHRGHSIDARAISDDKLNGRAIAPTALEGYLYSSYGGRVTATVVKNLRVYAGYAIDTNNRYYQATNRLTLGVYTFNLYKTGVDLTVTENRMTRGSSSSWNSLYISLGRTLGGRVYVTADFSTSVSLLRFTRFDGILIETKPNTKRFSASGMFTLRRTISVQFTAEHTTGDTYSENRVMTGLTYRF